MLSGEVQLSHLPGKYIKSFFIIHKLLTLILNSKIFGIIRAFYYVTLEAVFKQQQKRLVYVLLTIQVNLSHSLFKKPMSMSIPKKFYFKSR